MSLDDKPAEDQKEQAFEVPDDWEPPSKKERLREMPIVGILGNESAEAILMSLHHAHGDLSVTHIAEKTGRDRRTIYQHLDGLENIGLVEKRKAGNTSLWSFTDSEITQAWRDLHSLSVTNYDPED